MCVDCQPTLYTLHDITEPWPGPGANHAVNGNIANQTGMQVEKLVAPTLRAGSKLVIALTADPTTHAMATAHYQAFDAEGTKIIDDTETIANLPPGGGQGGTTIGSGALSPLVVFQLDLVGPVNGYTSYMSSGGGTITYSSKSAAQLAHARKIPNGCADTGTSTGENTNSTYSAVSALAGTKYTQTFGFVSETEFTAGGALAAIRGTDGRNHVFAVDAATQLVEAAVSSTGTWKAPTAGVSNFLLSGSQPLVALADSGGKTTLLGIGQDTRAFAFEIKADGKLGNATKIQPKGGFPRSGANVAATVLSGSTTRELFAIQTFKLLDSVKDNELVVTTDSGHGWGSSVSLTPSPLRNPSLPPIVTTLAPHAPLVASPRAGVPDETDVITLDANGTFSTTAATGSGGWRALEPPLTNATALVPGGELAVVAPANAPTQMDVLTIDTQGDLNVFASTAGGAWSAQTISSPGHLAKGGRLVAAPDFGIAGRTNVFTFDAAGTLEIYSINPKGKWNTPQVIHKATAPPGAALVAIQDSSVDTQTDVFYIDNAGKLAMLRSSGRAWKGPTSPSETCMPGYQLTHGNCSRNCTAPNMTLGPYGVCNCVAGTTRDTAGGCSTCEAGTYRDRAGNCTRMCITLHSIETSGTCGCAPGYLLDVNGLCTQCASGYSSVPPACVAPTDVAQTKCVQAGGVWIAGAADPCYFAPNAARRRHRRRWAIDADLRRVRSRLERDHVAFLAFFALRSSWSVPLSVLVDSGGVVGGRLAVGALTVVGGVVTGGVGAGLTGVVGVVGASATASNGDKHAPTMIVTP